MCCTPHPLHPHPLPLTPPHSHSPHSPSLCAWCLVSSWTSLCRSLPPLCLDSCAQPASMCSGFEPLFSVRGGGGCMWPAARHIGLPQRDSSEPELKTNIRPCSNRISEPSPQPEIFWEPGDPASLHRVGNTTSESVCLTGFGKTDKCICVVIQC